MTMEMLAAIAQEIGQCIFASKVPDVTMAQAPASPSASEISGHSLKPDSTRLPLSSAHAASAASASAGCARARSDRANT